MGPHVSMWRSEPQMPAPRTCTRTRPWSASGRGTSTTSIPLSVCFTARKGSLLGPLVAPAGRQHPEPVPRARRAGVVRLVAGVALPQGGGATFDARDVGLEELRFGLTCVGDGRRHVRSAGEPVERHPRRRGELELLRVAPRDRAGALLPTQVAGLAPVH